MIGENFARGIINVKPIRKQLINTVATSVNFKIVIAKDLLQHSIKWHDEAAFCAGAGLLDLMVEHVMTRLVLRKKHWYVT